MTTEEIENRCGQMVNEYFKKYGEGWSVEEVPWIIGLITMTIFRKYLSIRVKSGKLICKKDEYGIKRYYNNKEGI